MFEKELLYSEVLGDTSEYLVITELPTKFRSYGDINKLYVRGLYMEESGSLAKFIGNTKTPDYTQLHSIYKDVIKGIEVEKLELVDFIILMIISSIWTIDDFGWNPNIQCSNILEPSGERCDGVITSLITIDDFEFDEPMVEKLPIELNIRSKSILIGALTLGNVIEKELYLKNNPSIDKKILNYAGIIVNEDMSFEDKISFISKSMSKHLADIPVIDREIYVPVKPVLKACPKCNHKNRLMIKLTEIRGYP